MEAGGASVFKAGRDHTGPSLDPGLSRHLLERGGRNPYGEPMFRLVWGGSRLAWRHGEWEDYDEATGELARKVVEARQIPKYLHAVNRFHIEVWRPPEYWGTPEEWARTTQELSSKGYVCDILGEYPSRGEYDSVDVVEDGSSCECGLVSDGSVCGACKTRSRFVMPSREYIDFFLAAYRAATQKHTRSEIKAIVDAAAAKKQSDRFEYYLSRIKDNAPAFEGAVHTSFAGLEGPGKKEEIVVV